MGEGQTDVHKARDHMWVYVPLNSEEGIDHLEMELQVIKGHLMWVLRIELRSTELRICSYHCVIFPVLTLTFNRWVQTLHTAYLSKVPVTNEAWHELSPNSFQYVTKRILQIQILVLWEPRNSLMQHLV